MSSPTKPKPCFPNEPCLPESNISYQVFIQLCDHSARTVKKRQIIITWRGNQAAQRKEFVFVCGCRVQRATKTAYFCFVSCTHTFLLLSLWGPIDRMHSSLLIIVPTFADEMHVLIPTMHNNTHIHPLFSSTHPTASSLCLCSSSSGLFVIVYYGGAQLSTPKGLL